MIEIKPKTVFGALLRKVGGFLGGFTWRFWAILLAVSLACLPVAYCKGLSDGKAIESAKHDRAARKAVERAREADEGAAERRAADDKENTDASNERKDAILDAGRDGLNCARLRRAYPDRSIPACD